MIFPDPRSFMTRPAARQHKKAPYRLVLMVFCQAASSASSRNLCRTDDTRVVHQDVQPSVLPDSLLNATRNVLRIGNIPFTVMPLRHQTP